MGLTVWRLRRRAHGGAEEVWVCVCGSGCWKDNLLQQMQRLIGGEQIIWGFNCGEGEMTQFLIKWQWMMLQQFSPDFRGNKSENGSFWAIGWNYILITDVLIATCGTAIVGWYHLGLLSNLVYILWICSWMGLTFCCCQILWETSSKERESQDLTNTVNTLYWISYLQKIYEGPKLITGQGLRKKYLRLWCLRLNKEEEII